MATRKRPDKRTPALTSVTMVKNRGTDAETTMHWYQTPEGTQSGRGVTTLLSGGVPAPFLKTWAERLVAEAAVHERDQWENLPADVAVTYLRGAPDRDRDAAGGRGTEVHHLAEALNQGEEVEVPEEILGHVDSYIEFLKDWEPEIVASEMIGANWKYRYFGRFDLLVKVKGWPGREADESLVLLDIKTARSGYRSKDALQLVAYANFEVAGVPSEHVEKSANKTEDHLYDDDLKPMPKVDGIGVLHLGPDRYQVVPVKPERWQRLFATFIHAMRLAEFSGGEFLDKAKWTETKGWGECDVFDAPLLEPAEPF